MNTRKRLWTKRNLLIDYYVKMRLNKSYRINKFHNFLEFLRSFAKRRHLFIVNFELLLVLFQCYFISKLVFENIFRRK